MLYMYRFLLPLRLGWMLVCCLYKEVGPVNQVNHTSWVAVVTPTDRPKSVRNRCVIELFCSVVCSVTLPFWHFCWCRGFCHRTESDLCVFLWIIYSRNIKQNIGYLTLRKKELAGNADYTTCNNFQKRVCLWQISSVISIQVWLINIEIWRYNT